MTLPSSGAISMYDINLEFNRGYSMSSYIGTRYWNPPNSGGASTVTTGLFASSFLNFNDFYSKRGVTQLLASHATSGVNQSTYTWTGQYFGEEHSSRVLVLIAALTGGGTISSPKINGVTPTTITGATGGGIYRGVYYLAYPTVTSGSIQFTGSSSPLGASFNLYALYGVSAAPVLSGSKTGAVTSFPTLSLQANDLAIYGDVNSATFSGTGILTDVVNYGNGTGNNPYTLASLRAETAGNYTISDNQTTTGFPFYAVWRRA